MFDVFQASGQMFVAWFNFHRQEPGDQHWYFTFGNFDGAVAELTLFESRDGQFNGGAPVNDVTVGP